MPDGTEKDISDEIPFEIPQSWEWVRLDSCGELISGSGFPKAFQGSLGEEYPFYKVGSLSSSNSHGVIQEENNTVSRDIARKLKATIIPQNAILFAKIGEAIRLNRRCFPKKQCCIDNNMMAFVPEIGNLSFIYTWMKCQDFYSLSVATAVPSIRKGDLKALLLPFPPIGEQQRIVETLETVLSHIAL